MIEESIKAQRERRRLRDERLAQEAQVSLIPFGLCTLRTRLL